MKLVTPHNYDHKKAGEKTTGRSSLTVPDQTMSIQEILARFTRGLRYDQGKVPIYSESEDPIPFDPKRLDLAEIEELAIQTKATIKLHKDASEAASKKKQQDKDKKLKDLEQQIEEFNKTAAKQQTEIKAP